uniref:Uncharacterized protein n=1 Tax=Molossus molossus TaxID=27622 RepID=A0A7J8GK80_MOLMO|nr:hypothetical protein HJG59_011429 [Molossus molossus]
MSAKNLLRRGCRSSGQRSNGSLQASSVLMERQGVDGWVSLEQRRGACEDVFQEGLHFPTHLFSETLKTSGRSWALPLRQDGCIPNSMITSYCSFSLQPRLSLPVDVFMFSSYIHMYGACFFHLVAFIVKELAGLDC